MAGMIMKPGFTLRCAEMVVVMFREWKADTDLAEFARTRFPDADPNDVTFAVALFDVVDTIEQATDLVENAIHPSPSIKGKSPMLKLKIAVMFMALVVPIVIAAWPAIAEPKKPPLTNGEALSMLQALRNLDGRLVVLKQGATESTVTMPWDFGSGTLRLRIAKNISALAGVEKTIDDARQAIIKELTKAAEVPLTPNSPQFPDFQKQMTDVLSQGASVDLSRIRASELKLDKNEIPVTALSALAPIIDDDLTPK